MLGFLFLSLFPLSLLLLHFFFCFCWWWSCCRQWLKAVLVAATMKVGGRDGRLKMVAAVVFFSSLLLFFFSSVTSLFFFKIFSHVTPFSNLPPYLFSLCFSFLSLSNFSSPLCYSLFFRSSLLFSLVLSFLSFYFFFLFPLSFFSKCSPLFFMIPSLVFIIRGGESHLTPAMAQSKVGNEELLAWHGSPLLFSA